MATLVKEAYTEHPTLEIPGTPYTATVHLGELVTQKNYYFGPLAEIREKANPETEIKLGSLELPDYHDLIIPILDIYPGPDLAATERYPLLYGSVESLDNSPVIDPEKTGIS